MKRFLSKLFNLSLALALTITLMLLARSSGTLDEWHGWTLLQPSHRGLLHCYVLSNGGRAEIQVTLSRRTDVYGLPVAVPDSYIPTYPSEQLHSRTPTNEGWTYADSFVPYPKFNHGFAVAHESKVEPAEGPRKIATYFLHSKETKLEDRYLLVVPYRYLAGLFLFPLIWQLIFSQRKKPLIAASATNLAPR